MDLRTGTRQAFGLFMLGALALLALPAGAEAQGSDRDCSDFPNQAAAQSFFLAAGGPGQDPHSLDGDHDGVACESLPCPCATSASPGQGIVGTAPVTTPSPAPSGRAMRLRGVVTNVVDGDTIDVETRSGRTVRVRLVGIDTPEVHGGYECGGPRASRFMRSTALNKRVRLATDPTQDRYDRYGRLLAYATRAGGLSLQLAVLRAGFAKVYVYNEDPFQRVGEFEAAQEVARAANRGAWGFCGPDF